PRGAEARGREGDDAVEDLRETLRARELAAELEQRLRALRLAPLGLVEPRVLERDRGLAGEHLEQAHVVLVELVQAELRDPDDADNAGAVAQRDVDLRLLDHVRPRHLARVGVVRRVADQERLADLGAVARDALAELAREDVHRRLRARREGAAEPSASASSQPGRMTPNSSPPSRQTTSEPRTTARSVAARLRRTSSPVPCPYTSFTRLKSSMSSMSSATESCERLARWSSSR